MNVAGLRLEDPAAGTRPPSPTATVGAVSGAVACPWGPGPDPSTSSPLDDDDEFEDVDDEFRDEGATAEIFTWGSVVARTDWISWTSSSSSSSGEDVEGSGSCPQGHATAPETGPTGAVGEDGRVPPAGSSSQRPATSISTESSSYHVSTSNSVEVAATLGMPNAKLIGGNIVGSLRFSSNDRERRFLAEAGSAFGFPLMEKCLMASGVS